MLADTLRLRALAEHYLGADWMWALALIEHESSGNPWAVGDGGKAVGILQQHLDFQETYYPQHYDPVWTDTDKRWHPAFQLACLAEFWKQNAALPIDQKLAKYHQGHVTADPDYVSAVHDCYAKLK